MKHTGYVEKVALDHRQNLVFCLLGRRRCFTIPRERGGESQADTIATAQRLLLAAIEGNWEVEVSGGRGTFRNPARAESVVLLTALRPQAWFKTLGQAEDEKIDVMFRPDDQNAGYVTKVLFGAVDAKDFESTHLANGFVRVVATIPDLSGSEQDTLVIKIEFTRATIKSTYEVEQVFIYDNQMDITKVKGSQDVVATVHGISEDTVRGSARRVILSKGDKKQRYPRKQLDLSVDHKITVAKPPFGPSGATMRIEFEIDTDDEVKSWSYEDTVP